MVTACAYHLELELITPKYKGAEDGKDNDEVVDDYSDDAEKDIGKSRIMMRVIDLTIWRQYLLAQNVFTYP